MADQPSDRTPAPDKQSGQTPRTPPDAGSSSKKAPDILPAMSEQEIRDAGLAVDVPFETTGTPERLRYANLGKPATDGA